MIPAVLIYWLFPKNPIGVRGPLGGLTINASGAFAAYVIVFGLAFPIVRDSEDVLRGLTNPVWTVSAKVSLLDEKGNKANPDWLKSLGVELHPDFYTTANDVVRIVVPEINGSVPNIVFRVPNFGSQVLDIEEEEGEGRLIRDKSHKTIKVSKPIEIKKIPVVTTGLAAGDIMPPNVPFH